MMDRLDIQTAIKNGITCLGIEFGSTRIKGVLIDYSGNVLATGDYEWENSLVDGIWTYDLQDVDTGLRACYTALRKDVEKKYGITPSTFGAIGISGMMHGYIALDKDNKQLARFQTWRNTNTTAAADKLTELFQFNIPLRWSVAHLYQRMLDQEKLYREIDMVTTPSGFPCAMSHANNGTSDLNAWVGLFHEFCGLMGIEADMGTLFGKLYTHSLNGDPDCGGLLPYGYYSGENITFINEGRPLFVRTPDSRFNLANFMRANLYTSVGAVKLGMDILLKDEGVPLDRIMGHGSLFKTPRVMQQYLAAAVNTPVTVMATASEGGAWGIALLAAYLADGKKDGKLEDYLDKRIFANLTGEAATPSAEVAAGFESFIKHYVAGLEIERTAITCVNW